MRTLLTISLILFVTSIRAQNAPYPYGNSKRTGVTKSYTSKSVPKKTPYKVIWTFNKNSIIMTVDSNDSVMTGYWKNTNTFQCTCCMNNVVKVGDLLIWIQNSENQVYYFD